MQKSTVYTAFLLKSISDTGNVHLYDNQASVLDSVSTVNQRHESCNFTFPPGNKQSNARVVMN